MKRLLLLTTLLALACTDAPATQDTPDAPVDTPDVSVDAPEDMVPEPTEDMDVAPDLEEDATPDVAPDLSPDMSMNCAPVPGEMTREGHASDGWTWEKGGRVFPQDPAEPKPTQGDFAPTLIRQGDVYRLYFARRRDSGFTIWTTTSPDGDTWAAPEEVQGLEGPNYPAALARDDGGVDLWFGSGSFDRASSDDGVNFLNQERGILRPTDVGGFASISMIYPEVRKTQGGAYAMWFMGFSGDSFRIGQATSPNGTAWTPAPDFVLERGDTFDSTSVGQPEVHRVGDTWYMWYGGYDTSRTDPGPWRVGLATSPDGVTWERRGVTMPLSVDGDDMWSTRDPAVIQTEDGGWLMVYVGMRSDSHYRLLTARSRTCL